jgi:hypothetical protein
MKIWLYTVISAVFVFLVLKLVNRLLMPREHLTIEEAINTNIQTENRR